MSETPQNTMSGISNPPDGGEVNTVDNADISDPNSNDQTVSQTAAPSTPQTTPQAGQVPMPGATPGPTGQPQVPGQPQGALPNKAPNVKPGQNTPNGPIPPAQNPAVAKASTFHDVAEALAGGPRYAYDVDAYGNM